MSNKARHAELIKRLDKIIELLGNMQRINALQHQEQRRDVLGNPITRSQSGSLSHDVNGLPRAAE